MDSEIEYYTGNDVCHVGVLMMSKEGNMSDVLSLRAMPENG